MMSKNPQELNSSQLAEIAAARAQKERLIADNKAAAARVLASIQRQLDSQVSRIESVTARNYRDE